MDCPIYIVDDDKGVRTGLLKSLSHLGYTVETYSSAEEFLQHYESNGPACLVLDLVMPKMHGLELIKHIAKLDPISIIVLTGHGDVPTAVQSFKFGAVDYIEKPVEHEILVEVIEAALRKSQAAAEYLVRQKSIQARLDRLTSAERVVMDLLVRGLTTREIADELHRSDRTVGNQRQSILNKMKVKNTTELTQLNATMKSNDFA